MAILQQTYFSPLYGFNETDKINKFIAAAPLDFGKVVVPANTTGILGYGTTYGYFLYEHVTVDGPSIAELGGDIPQYEKMAGPNTAVTCLIAKPGNVVRTRWVAQGAGGVAIAVGNLFDLVAGVFTTNAGDNGTMGLLKNIYTDSLGNTLYDVEIL